MIKKYLESAGKPKVNPISVLTVRDAVFYTDIF